MLTRLKNLSSGTYKAMFGFYEKADASMRHSKLYTYYHNTKAWIANKYDNFNDFYTNQLKPYVITQAKKMLGDPNQEVVNLLDEQKKINTKLLYKPFRILGNIALYKPDSEKELKIFLKTADQQKDARCAYLPFTIFGNGHSLLSETGPQGLKHHNQLAKYLIQNQQKLLNHALKLLHDSVNENKQISHSDISNIIRKTLASTVFGIDSISNKDMAHIDYTGKWALHNSSSIAHITQFDSSKYVAKTEFIEVSKKILKTQIHKLQLFFSQYPESKGHSNLITDKIIELVQRKDPTLKDDKLIKHLNKFTADDIQNYLNHSEVSGLLTVLFGSEFLSKAILNGIDYLRCFPKLEDEIKQHNPITNDDQIDWVSLQSMPLLNVFYKAILQTLDKPNIIPRYFAQETKLEGLSIPKNTTVYVNLQQVNQSYGAKECHYEEYNAYMSNFMKQAEIRFSTPKDSKNTSSFFVPFSTGPRQCPGNRLSETLFKMTMVFLVNSYELKLVHGGNEITYTCTPKSPFLDMRDLKL